MGAREAHGALADSGQLVEPAVAVLTGDIQTALILAVTFTQSFTILDSAL